MAKTQSSGKKTNPLVFIGIGCLALIVLASVGSVVVGKFFAKKIVQGVIENRTGIKTNLQDAENGKMTFTDTKTGEKVDIGSGKIPDTFPKDFPLYPGVKVLGALSGNQSGANNGFLLTMSSTDSLDKVSVYYKTQLEKNGWTITETYTQAGTTTYSVEKSAWSGTMGITEDTGSKETQIIITLNQ